MVRKQDKTDARDSPSHVSHPFSARSAVVEGSEFPFFTRLLPLLRAPLNSTANVYRCVMLECISGIRVSLCIISLLSTPSNFSWLILTIFFLRPGDACCFGTLVKESGFSKQNTTQIKSIPFFYKVSTTFKMNFNSKNYFDDEMQVTIWCILGYLHTHEQSLINDAKSVLTRECEL